MKRHLSTFLLLAATSGIVSAAVAQAEVDSIRTKSGMLGAAEVGKGQVIFYRPPALMWAIMGCGVREGGAEVTKLGIGKYAIVAASPGTHEYTTGGKKGRISLQVDAGKSYFIICRISKGIVGRAQLTRSDRDEFADEADGLTSVGS